MWYDKFIKTLKFFGFILFLGLVGISALAKDEPKKAVKSEPKYVDFVRSENRLKTPYFTLNEGYVAQIPQNAPELKIDAIADATTGLRTPENLALIRSAILDCQINNFCQ